MNQEVLFAYDSALLERSHNQIVSRLHIEVLVQPVEENRTKREWSRDFESQHFSKVFRYCKIEFAFWLGRLRLGDFFGNFSSKRDIVFFLALAFAFCVLLILLLLHRGELCLLLLFGDSNQLFLRSINSLLELSDFVACAGVGIRQETDQVRVLLLYNALIPFFVDPLLPDLRPVGVIGLYVLDIAVDSADQIQQVTLALSGFFVLVGVCIEPSGLRNLAEF